MLSCKFWYYHDQWLTVASSGTLVISSLASKFIFKNSEYYKNFVNIEIVRKYVRVCVSACMFWEHISFYYYYKIIKIVQIRPIGWQIFSLASLMFSKFELVYFFITECNREALFIVSNIISNISVSTHCLKIIYRWIYLFPSVIKCANKIPS